MQDSCIEGSKIQGLTQWIPTAISSLITTEAQPKFYLLKLSLRQSLPPFQPVQTALKLLQSLPTKAWPPSRCVATHQLKSKKQLKAWTAELIWFVSLQNWNHIKHIGPKALSKCIDKRK